MDCLGLAYHGFPVLFDRILHAPTPTPVHPATNATKDRFLSQLVQLRHRAKRNGVMFTVACDRKSDVTVVTSDGGTSEAADTSRAPLVIPFPTPPIENQ